MKSMLAAFAVCGLVVLGLVTGSAQETLTDSQLAYGCKQTKPNCVKVSNIRLVPGPRTPEATIAEVLVVNRCGQPVLVKVCFEQSDFESDCTDEILSNKEKRQVQGHGLTKQYVEKEDQIAQRTGTYPPWGDIGAGVWATGRVSFAWIGVPKKEEYYYHTCETEMFEEIEYEFGGSQ